MEKPESFFKEITCVCNIYDRVQAQAQQNMFSEALVEKQIQINLRRSSQ